MEIKAKFWIENKGEVVFGGAKLLCSWQWIGWVPSNEQPLNLECLIGMFGERLKRLSNEQVLKSWIQR